MSRVIISKHLEGLSGNPKISQISDDSAYIVWSSYSVISLSDSCQCSYVDNRIFDLTNNPAKDIYLVTFNFTTAQISDARRINNFIADDQFGPSISTSITGDTLITWISANQDGSGLGIYGKIISKNTDSVDIADVKEFRINSFTVSDQSEVTSCALPNGNLVVAWSSACQDGDGSGIFAKVLNHKGEHIKLGEYYQQNDIEVYEFNKQQDRCSNNNPELIKSADDSCSIVQGYQSHNKESEEEEKQLSEEDIEKFYAQKSYERDSCGTIVDKEYEILVNTFRHNNQYHPAITCLANNGFVVTWISDGQDGDGKGVYAQIFDQFGNKLGREIQVNTNTPLDQYEQAIAATPDNKFVIVWTAQLQGQDGNNSGNTGIFGQRFDHLGNKLDIEFRIDAAQYQHQHSPNVKIANDNTYTITWLNNDQYSGIYTQRYDFKELFWKPWGPQKRLLTDKVDNQLSYDFFILDSNIILAWQGSGYISSDNMIFAEIVSESSVSHTDSSTRTETISKSFSHTFTESLYPPTLLQLRNSVTPVYLNNASGTEYYGTQYAEHFYISPDVMAMTIYGGGGADIFTISPSANSVIKIIDFRSSNIIDLTNFPQYTSRSQLSLAKGSCVITIDSQTIIISNVKDCNQVPDSSFMFVAPCESGYECRVNTYIRNNQQNSKVAALSDGGYVIVWQSYGQDGSGWGIFGQIFNSDGTKRGQEFQVNTNTIGDQKDPVVVGIDHNKFAVAWLNSNPPASIFKSETNVHGPQAQYALCDLSKTKVCENALYINRQTSTDYAMDGIIFPSDRPFEIDDMTARTYFDINNVNLSNLRILYVKQSNYLIFGWIGRQSVEADYALGCCDSGIQYISYDPKKYHCNSDVVKGEYTLACINSGKYSYSGVSLAVHSVAAGKRIKQLDISDHSSIYSVSNLDLFTLKNQLILLSSQLNPFTKTNSVVAFSFTIDLSSLGASVPLNSYTKNRWFNPTAASINSTIFIAWQSQSEDGSAGGIFARAFDRNFNPISDEVQINSYTLGDQINQSVTTINNGTEIVVVWSSMSQDGSLEGIYGQKIQYNSRIFTFDGDEFRINLQICNAQTMPSVSSIGNGANYVVSWSSKNQDGSANGVFSKVLSVNGYPKGIQSIDASKVSSAYGGYLNTNYSGFLKSNVGTGNSNTVTSKKAIFTTSTQDLLEDYAFFDNGNYIIVYVVSIEACPALEIRARLYGQNNQQIGEQIIGKYNAINNIKVEALNDGSAIVAWSVPYVDSDQNAILFIKIAPSTQILSSISTLFSAYQGDFDLKAIPAMNHVILVYRADTVNIISMNLNVINDNAMHVSDSIYETFVAELDFQLLISNSNLFYLFLYSVSLEGIMILSYFSNTTIINKRFIESTPSQATIDVDVGGNFIVIWQNAGYSDFGSFYSQTFNAANQNVTDVILLEGDYSKTLKKALYVDYLSFQVIFVQSGDIVLNNIYNVTGKLFSSTSLKHLHSNSERVFHTEFVDPVTIYVVIIGIVTTLQFVLGAAVAPKIHSQSISEETTFRDISKCESESNDCALRYSIDILKTVLKQYKTYPDAAIGLISSLLSVKNMVEDQLRRLTAIVDISATVSYDFTKPASKCGLPFIVKYAKSEKKIIYFCQDYFKVELKPQYSSGFLLGSMSDKPSKFQVLVQELALIVDSSKESIYQNMPYQYCRDLMRKSNDDPPQPICFNAFLYSLNGYFESCIDIGKFNVKKLCQVWYNKANFKILDAVESAQTKLNILSSMVDINDSLKALQSYTDYICATSSSDWSTLREQLVLMNTRFNQGIEIGITPAFGINGWTQQYEKNTFKDVYVNSNAENYVKTFFHELSHATIGTNDFVSDKEGCKSAALQCNFIATSTAADCIAWFMFDAV